MVFLLPAVLSTLAVLCRGASQLRIRKLANATAASITCVSMVAFTQVRSPLGALALHTTLVFGNSFDYCGWFPNSKAASTLFLLGCHRSSSALASRLSFPRPQT